MVSKHCSRQPHCEFDRAWQKFYCGRIRVLRTARSKECGWIVGHLHNTVILDLIRMGSGTVQVGRRRTVKTVDPADDVMNPAYDDARGIDGGRTRVLPPTDLLREIAGGGFARRIKAVRGTDYSLATYGLLRHVGTPDYFTAGILPISASRKILTTRGNGAKMFTRPTTRLRHIIDEVPPDAGHFWGPWRSPQ